MAADKKPTTVAGVYAEVEKVWAELEHHQDLLDGRDALEPEQAAGGVLPSVQQALAAVMRDMPGIAKDQTSSHADYKYRGIEQVTAQVQRLFGKHGVVVVPSVQSVDIDHITVNGRPWQDVRMLVLYTVVGPDGSQLQATCFGIGRDNSDKGANKAMTQAYKYLLLQLLCISDAKDDADGYTHEADHTADVPTYSPEDLASATQLYEQLVAAKGTPTAEHLKAWAVEQQGSLREPDLREPEWRGKVQAELERLQQDTATEGPVAEPEPEATPEPEVVENDPDWDPRPMDRPQP